MNIFSITETIIRYGKSQSNLSFDDIKDLIALMIELKDVDINDKDQMIHDAEKLIDLVGYQLDLKEKINFYSLLGSIIKYSK